MRKAQFFYLLRRGLLSGGLNLIKEGLVMASKFTTQGLSFPAQGSAEFNGTSDFIQTDNAFNNTKHTIAAWVYNDTTSGGQVVFDNRDTNDDGVRILGSSGTFFYQLNASDRTFTMPTAGNWYFITATYDGSLQKLYLDGSLQTSVITSQTIDTTTDATLARRSFEANDYMDGNLANVAIWNRALSSDEINSVMWKSYEGLTGAESNGLQAWYSLDDISGTSVPDSSGNGNDGTAY